MKTLQTLFLFLAVTIIFISCSSDNEIFDVETGNKNSQEKNLPMEPLPVGAIELPGYPRSIKKYQNGELHYWAQYYYRPDGNLFKVKYKYTKSNSEIFTDTYHYNSEGKLVKVDGHDVYDFHWDNNRIVEADKYNSMWHGRSKIFYEYNPEGQLIQKTENHLDFFYSEKIIYSYFEDGNLKTIAEFGSNESGILTQFFVTNFDGYNQDKNLFLELEIIPGQIVQHQFPSSMSFKHLTATGYDISETYEYKYDTQGRVIEKISGRNKVVYDYY